MAPQDVSHGDFDAGQDDIMSEMQSIKEQMKQLEQRLGGMRPCKRSRTGVQQVVPEMCMPIEDVEAGKLWTQEVVDSGVSLAGSALQRCYVICLARFWYSLHHSRCATQATCCQRSTDKLCLTLCLQIVSGPGPAAQRSGPSLVAGSPAIRKEDDIPSSTLGSAECFCLGHLACFHIRMVMKVRFVCQQLPLSNPLEFQLCQLARIDDILREERPLLADIRWLRLLLDSELQSQQAVQRLLNMRLTRLVGDRDLEWPYHSIILRMLQVRSEACLYALHACAVVYSQNLVLSLLTFIHVTFICVGY